MSGSDRRRLVDKLVRELVRGEAQALEHPAREARRIGESPPVTALREVANHALAMKPRLQQALEGHDLVSNRRGINTTLATLRQIVTDRIHDSERAYRTSLLDLRHCVEVVRVLRDVARIDHHFAVIRWCDDWLPARRTLISRVEAQLAWFADQSFIQDAAASIEGPGDNSTNEWT